MSVTTPPVGTPMSAADMQKMMAQMMELSKPGENHKLLASMDGNWTYTVKMWMNPDPAAKPTETKGSAVIKPALDGRFFVGDYTGQMQMPGAGGKIKTAEFKGHGVNGYDNVKKKFVATWFDNMGTSITYMEGDYDPATNSVTYTGEMEAIPGMKTSVRQVVKLVDKDHFNFEWFENRGVRK